MYGYRKLNAAERAALVENKLARGYPPHSPPHFTSEQGLYLLTASCYKHRAQMATPERREQLLDQLFEKFTLEGIEIRAWVVLPNHYHLLLFSPDGAHFGSLLRLVHGRTSYLWNREDGHSGRKVWYQYSDRAMRSERHTQTTLNYIHYNPVKHGYTSSPYDWQVSSVHWYRHEYGREWLREQWRQYPIRDYGKEWGS